MSNNSSINQFNPMTTAQIQQLRYLHADRKHATGIYHDCLKRKVSVTERHAAEAACTATMAALKAFTATL
jgi:hypothetical protein